MAEFLRIYSSLVNNMNIIKEDVVCTILFKIFYILTFYYKLKQIQKNHIKQMQIQCLSLLKWPTKHYPGQDVELCHPPQKSLLVLHPSHNSLPPPKTNHCLNFIVFTSLCFFIFLSLKLSILILYFGLAHLKKSDYVFKVL